MAKVSRSVLKEIVKECLLEILFEGIDSEPGYEEEEPIREARQPRRRAPRPSKRSLAAAVEQEQRQSRPKRKAPINENHFRQQAANLTEDPMMQSIFADTAMTTLQEQKEGRRPPADNAAAVVQGTDDLENLFAGASNWAAIAFNDGES